MTSAPRQGTLPSGDKEETPMKRRTLLLAPLALPAVARAQGAFPDRGLRYIVPFPPGGLTDIMARLVAQKMSENLGRPVVVDNRAGGNALIGADAAAKAPPDGYTLLAITLTHAVNTTLFPNAPYDFRRDLTTISLLGSLPLVVVVNAERSPARDLAGLIQLARTRPLNGGSSGNGSPPHLGLELLRRVANAGDNIVHVPYRGGAPSVTDLAAGNLDVMVSNLPECLAQIRGGRLRPLAITSAERHALVPAVPTVRELGAPGLEITNWTAVMTQSATPEPIRARLEREVLAAIHDADTSRRAREGGFQVLGWDAARSGAFVRAETDRWATLVREANIRPDA
jgi:tripartite-type tricarboxylate transporter receptor subunit TctC